MAGDRTPHADLWVLITGHYEADIDCLDDVPGWAYLFTTREKALEAIYGPLMGHEAPRLAWRKVHDTCYEAMSMDPDDDVILYTLTTLPVDDDYGPRTDDAPPTPDLDHAPFDWPD